MNWLRMMSLYQREFHFKAVVFTHSKVIVREAHQFNITVVRSFPWAFFPILISSLNPFGMPYVNSMFQIVASQFKSDYYGYINSDILFTFNLLDVLELCKKNAELGNISKRVNTGRADHD